MKSILSLLIIIIFGSSLWAHDGVLSGRVLDQESGEGLPGAVIRLMGTDQYAVSNELGYFTFEGLKDQPCSIMVSFLGYEPRTLGNLRPGSTEQAVKVRLQPAQIDLPMVEIQPVPRQNEQLLSRVDLKERPIRNAQEVLQFVPGLIIAQHAGGGKAEQIFLRGFDIDHGTDVQLTVDGMPVNMVSHAHGQGYADLHFVIPELIGKVVYQKGPYDAANGNFSTAGAVGFQTLDRLDRSFVKAEAGQFNSYRVLAGAKVLDGGRSGQSAYVAADYNFSDGYFESSQNFYRFNALAKYNYEINENQRLQLTLSTFASEWDASGQIPERAVRQGRISRFGAIDDTEGGQTSRTNLNIEYSQMLSPNSFLKNQFYYAHYDFELYSNFTFFERDPVNGDQIRQRESRDMLGWKSALQHSTTFLGLDWNTEAGLGFRFDAVADNELSYTKNRRTTLEQVANGDIRELNLSAYVSQDVRFSPRFHLNAGLRFEQFRFQYEDQTEEAYQPQSVSASLLLPKLSLTYNVNSKLQLQWQSGIGYHSNDTRVVIPRMGREVLPTAFGSELGALFKLFPSLLTRLSLWMLNLEQEFVYVGDEGIVEPGGRTRRQGIDLSIRYQIRPWLRLDTDWNYAYARSREAESGEDYIPLAPDLTSTGGLRVGGDKGLSGGLRYRFLADRPANEDNSLTADGYFLLDAVVRYRFSDFEIGLSAQNLLNREWKEAQFETTSRLPGEVESVTEIHYTPGSPFFLRGQITAYF